MRAGATVRAQTVQMSEGAFSADRDQATGSSVGTVAALLGVAPGTLRSWGRRYGLVPAERSVGGHRRYTESDTRMLVRMQALVNAGETPSRAANIVRSTPDIAECSGDAALAVALMSATRGPGNVNRRGRRAGVPGGGPGGRVLAVPGASAQVRGLARAAGKLDTGAVATIIEHHLRTTGALPTWEDLLRPVLVAVGAGWARTGEGIDIEHLLSEAIMDALRAHRARQSPPRRSAPVLLAGSAQELHVLPLYVLGAALAERGVPTVLLGARVPDGALASAARRTRASAVFVWRGRTSTDKTDLRQLPLLRPRLRVVVGGSGWDDVPLATDVHRAHSLPQAISILQNGSRIEKLVQLAAGPK